MADIFDGPKARCWVRRVGEHPDVEAGFLQGAVLTDADTLEGAAVQAVQDELVPVEWDDDATDVEVLAPGAERWERVEVVRELVFTALLARPGSTGRS